MCIEAGLSRCLLSYVPWVVEGLFVGYKDVQGGFEELWNILTGGRQRNGGFSREKIRGVSMPPCLLQSTLSSAKLAGQPGHLSVRGSLPLI